MKRIFACLLVFWFWHSSASAVDYTFYYYIAAGGAGTGPFGSAPAACNAGIQHNRDNTQNTDVTFKALIPTSETQWTCAFSFKDHRGALQNANYFVRRFGTESPCTEYNPTTGDCVAPEEPEDQCSDKAGIEEAFSKAGQAPDSFMTISSSGMALPQRQGCKGGCATQVIDNRCKTRVSGSYYCRGLVVYSGEQCSTTGTGDQIGEDTNDSTEPETIKEDVPCIYSASGGKQVCESKKSEEKEGQSCGSVNGVETCIDKAPSKNGVDIRTEVSTETKPDGSSTTTKKDTATVTKCTGVNKCTSSTTTNTTTTNRDANGNVTSVTGKCTGEHCPDKKGDPDGDGDGFGDCVFGGCSEDEFGGGENEEVPGFGESAQAFMAKVKASPLVSSINGIAFPDGGSCSMSSTSTPLGTISGSAVCDNTHWLDPLYFVFLAVHALAAVRVLMSA